MVIVVLTEQVHVATVGWKGLVLQLLEVYELRLVNVKVIKREGVGGSLAVLGDDGADGTIVKRDGVLPVGGRDDRVGPSQLLGRLDADDVVLAAMEAPTFPVLEHGRYGIGETSLGVGRDESTIAARHPLHVAQVEGGVEDALSNTTTAHDYGVTGGNEVDLLLRWVEVLLYHTVFSSLISSVGVYSKSCSS